MRAPVESVRSDELVIEVARRMRDQNIGFVPVCDRVGRAIGVLTDRDVALRGLGTGVGAGRLPVFEIMTPGVVACHPGDDVGLVEALMRKNQLSRIVVVDARGVPVGVVSVTDLAQVIDVGETVRAIGEARIRPMPEAEPVDFGDDESAVARKRMVAEQVIGRGIHDPEVVRAVLEVPREVFAPADAAQRAYQDLPLPIGNGQTLPSMHVVAMTASALHLDAGDRVLEVGGDPGYLAAVLSRLCGEVHCVRASEPLAREAARAIVSLGLDNIEISIGDPARGLPQRGPFDAIAVNGPAGDTLPAALLDQLAIGGRMVFPISFDGGRRRLVRITRKDESTFQRDVLDDVRLPPGEGPRPSPAR